MKKMMLWLTAAGAVVLALTGCSAIEHVVSATKEKTLAIGSDTWGGGMELAVAEAEQPVPSLSGWFGRRRVWYVSVKDAQTGEAAAKIVKAGLSTMEVSATASGVTLGNKSAE